MCVCDFNCFYCEYEDCILSDLDVFLSESDFIDSILFSTDPDSIDIVVRPYTEYPFIPIEEIPYNPNWKSQKEWRKYYRSKVRGNRKEKIRATHRAYYKNHREEILAKHRLYYDKNREKIKERLEKTKESRSAYNSQYYQDHKDEIREGKRLWYQKNKARIREKQLLTRQRKEEGFE